MPSRDRDAQTRTDQAQAGRFEIFQIAGMPPNVIRAALTVALDVLTHGSGMVHIASPLDIEHRLHAGRIEPPAWMRRRISGDRPRTWADVAINAGTASGTF